MTARFTELFEMKTTRNNFNVTSTPNRNGVKIGNFVFTVTNVGFYVLPVREIILCSSPYKLPGCTLQSVTETVDLGVSLTSNLSWNTQTQKVVNKANKNLGLLKRNVGPGNKEVFSRLYKALVIPILEYAVPLLSPYLQVNIDALERVQRRASKYALPMLSRDSSYEERLAMLGLSSLQSRRSHLSLLECYKHIDGLMASTVMIILNLIVIVKQDQTIYLN